MKHVETPTDKAASTAGSDSEEDDLEVFYECNDEEDDGDKSEDFLFKDSYIEDQELNGLEYCYEPGIALGQMEFGINLVPFEHEHQQTRRLPSSEVNRCFKMAQYGYCSGCYKESG